MFRQSDHLYELKIACNYNTSKAIFTLSRGLILAYSSLKITMVSHTYNLIYILYINM